MLENTSSAMIEMPQWKRDLILRRRAQRDTSTTSSTTSPTSSCSEPPVAVTLGCRQVGGHQPAGKPVIATSSAGGGGGSSCRCGAVAALPSPAHGVVGGGTCDSTSTRASSSATGVSQCRSCVRAAASAFSSANTATQPPNVYASTCCAACNKMVHLQQPPSHDNDSASSSSSEELQYGPGIVSKLKSRYLSLTLRETVVKRRPSILLRKSTSLENLLDEPPAQTNHLHHHLQQQQQQQQNHHVADIVSKRNGAPRLYESRTNGTNGHAKNVAGQHHTATAAAVANRYHGGGRAARGMKRARSVEAISRIWSPKDDGDAPPRSPSPSPLIGEPPMQNGRPKSLQEGAAFSYAINPIITPRVNKPKRVQPVITEREKPPADVVKQAKRIFEARPETRTRPPAHTGEVAAKVATYKTIIIQNKQQANNVCNKPPIIKAKPILSPSADVVVNGNKTKPNIRLSLKQQHESNGGGSPVSPKSLPSPIPDVSMVSKDDTDEKHKNKSVGGLSETPDLILHSSPQHHPHDVLTKMMKECVLSYSDDGDTVDEKDSDHSNEDDQEEEDEVMVVETDVNPVLRLSPPAVPAPLEPLTLDVGGVRHNGIGNNRDPVLVLSPREIEKNAINAHHNVIKTRSNSGGVVPPANHSPCIEAYTPSAKASPEEESKSSPVVEVPPKAKARKSKQAPPAPVTAAGDSNCIVFKFTDRKDVPDYIGNDGTVRSRNVEMPKPGEGGFTILPGATIVDAFEEELASLKGPPSPCDVSFINDNILIDGKSSLSKAKSKKAKQRIQFVEAIPQVFEYPSEASMLIHSASTSDDSHMLNQPLGGTTVPSLSGSTLANYTPKAAASDFQLGVTKSPPPQPPPTSTALDAAVLDDDEEPVLFSSGTNSDILF